MVPLGFDWGHSDLALTKCKKNDGNYPQNSRKKVSNSRKKCQTPANPKKSYEWNFQDSSMVKESAYFQWKMAGDDPTFTYMGKIRMQYCSMRFR